MTELREENSTDIKKMKRLASLDFQRGLSIFLMCFLHVFAWYYDISWADDVESLFGGSVPIPLVILAVLLGYFGGWAGYFLLISANVNALAMTKRARRGQKPEKILSKQVFTGIGILLAGRFTEAFMKNGWFGYVIRSGEPIFQASTWTNPLHWRTTWSRFFIMETLQTIGWCMILNGFIHYFLIRKEGYKKFKRNLSIYLGLTVSVLILTPIMHNWAANMYWPNKPDPEIMEFLGVPHSSEYHNSWPSEHFQAANASFKAYIMTVLTGDLEPLFPYLATSFIGSIFGLALAEPDASEKRIPFWGGIGTLLVLIAGVISTLIMGFNFTLERPDLAYYLLLLFGQLGVMVLMLWLVEFRGNAQKFGQNPIVKYFRLWGIPALTIFSLQILHWVPKAIFNWAFPNRNLITDLFGDQSLGFNPFSAIEVGYVFLFAFITLIVYQIVISLWSLVNFKYSFEWWIVRLGNIGSKRDTERLNVKKLMNNVEWISYKKNKKE